MSPHFWNINLLLENFLPFLRVQLDSSKCRWQTRDLGHLTVVHGPKQDQCELFLRIFKVTTMEESLSVAEARVKWKKADFRKGEQRQPVEAKMPSCPGGIHFKLILKPSDPCGFSVAGLLELVHPTLLLSVLLQVLSLLPAS